MIISHPQFNSQLGGYKGTPTNTPAMSVDTGGTYKTIGNKIGPEQSFSGFTPPRAGVIGLGGGGGGFGHFK